MSFQFKIFSFYFFLFERDLTVPHPCKILLSYPKQGVLRSPSNFRFFRIVPNLPKNMDKKSIARYIMRIAYCSRVKLKTFCRRLFAISFPKSRYGSPNIANFTPFEIFSKFNASFLSYEITKGDQTSQPCSTLTCLAILQFRRP